MREATTVAGIDLAASPHRPTGVAIAWRTTDKWRLTSVTTASYTDSQLIDLLAGSGVQIVVVDAPLTLPETGGFRRVEKLFLRIGARLLPLTIGSMRKLAARAARLAKTLRDLDMEVYETHPASVLRIAGCNSVEELLRVIGIDAGQPLPASRHALDAVVAVTVAVCIVEGCAESVAAEDGEIFYIRRKICER
ncbi:DUF429 domain-containing protein [Hyperthermus butylicus]|uniref:DUF429 domain-containing protein n=1 Tax=Hyperthermus butylicus (strain DSM 5456 / JCM 9403 / PLM1-5) TaxID=415426 RepID=A2BK02_HYPBU|nr:DUF429 domain-containing protein [Hyperthermus butylicus]ABM80313.1 hypothetical protein Hbut_0447 [Hyperthermus butylicus DSM 5456]